MGFRYKFTVIVFTFFVLFSFSKKDKTNQELIIGKWVTSRFYTDSKEVKFKKRKYLEIPNSGYVFKENGELEVRMRLQSFCGNAYRGESKGYYSYFGKYEFTSDTTVELKYTLPFENEIKEVLNIKKIKKRRLITNNIITGKGYYF